MTFYEYNLYAEGYFTRQNREWERARLIAWAALIPHTKKELQPADIMPLPSDPKPVEYSDEYFKSKNELMQMWNKLKTKA